MRDLDEWFLPTAEHFLDKPRHLQGNIFAPGIRDNLDTDGQAFAIANSPNLGMEFCTGCWLEGGKMFGNMLEAIRYFVEQKRIFIVHFRNVTAPLPEFTETFLDNGYMDMYEAMKIFVETGYDGTMILDHTPEFAGGYALGGGTGYAIGYMRALIERAEAG